MKFNTTIKYKSFPTPTILESWEESYQDTLEELEPNEELEKEYNEGKVTGLESLYQTLILNTDRTVVTGVESIKDVITKIKDVIKNFFSSIWNYFFGRSRLDREQNKTVAALLESGKVDYTKPVLLNKRVSRLWDSKTNPPANIEWVKDKAKLLESEIQNASKWLEEMKAATDRGEEANGGYEFESIRINAKYFSSKDNEWINGVKVKVTKDNARMVFSDQPYLNSFTQPTVTFSAGTIKELHANSKKVREDFDKLLKDLVALEKVFLKKVSNPNNLHLGTIKANLANLKAINKSLSYGVEGISKLVVDVCKKALKESK